MSRRPQVPGPESAHSMNHPAGLEILNVMAHLESCSSVTTWMARLDMARALYPQQNACKPHHLRVSLWHREGTCQVCEGSAGPVAPLALKLLVLSKEAIT